MKKLYLLLCVPVIGCSGATMERLIAENDTSGGLLTRMNKEKITKIRMEMHSKTCTTYGFEPKTEAFSNCLMQEEHARSNRASRGQMESNRNLQQQMNRTNSRNSSSMFPPTVRCTSSRMGHYIHTNCD